MDVLGVAVVVIGLRRAAGYGNVARSGVVFSAMAVRQIGQTSAVAREASRQVSVRRTATAVLMAIVLMERLKRRDPSAKTGRLRYFRRTFAQTGKSPTEIQCRRGCAGFLRVRRYYLRMAKFFGNSRPWRYRGV